MSIPRIDFLKKSRPFNHGISPTENAAPITRDPLRDNPPVDSDQPAQGGSKTRIRSNLDTGSPEMPDHRQGWSNAYLDMQQRMLQTQNPDLKAHFQAVLEVMKPTMDAMGIPTQDISQPAETTQPVGEPANATSQIGGEAMPAESSNPGEMIPVNGGGRVSYTFTNNSAKSQQIGFMQDPTNPMAVSGLLQPGESVTFSVPDGISGYFATADSDGRFQPSASRFEIFSEGDKANVNVSYITGRNASYMVTDQQGNTIGDNMQIAGNAPQNILTYDSANNPTITGWYDGSTAAMQAGGAYMENALGGTGGAYIHPEDDRLGEGQNPMTMAMNPSTNFSISIGDA